MRIRLLSALLCTAAFGADPTYESVLNQISYRNLGPFRAGGWVSALAVPETPTKAHQRVIYAAARTGGVWKSANAGITFENVTDSVSLSSVGAVAVAPSNENVVWVGSGDNSATRSAYYGNGVYRSTDAGKTWQNMGLADSEHIARIVIHPSNPDIVWIAALGHLFSPNQERGVFKTTDGGRTWKKVLYSGDKTGAVDLAIDPRNPNVLYAAMYEHIRYPWRLMDGGPSSGIYKTTDGGANWQRLEGGLPTGAMGRIGLDICRKSPDVLYAVVDNFTTRPATAQEAGGRGGNAPRAIGGEVYRTDDGGRTWRKTNSAGDDVSRKAGYSFNQLRVDPNNPEIVYITGSSMIKSADGGKTWAGLGGGGGGGGRGALEQLPFRRAFGDYRSLWIDAEDSDHMIATSDGGVFISYDGGRNSQHMMGLKLGEIYAIGVDMAQPYNIYAGLQDHENWRGPSEGPSGQVGIEDWVTTGIGDGMYNQPDPAGRYLYNTQEFGHLARVDMDGHARTVIEPRREQGKPFLRYNWTAPVRLSPHDGRIVYYGAQVLFRSKDRGDHWDEISPDLTTNDPNKITPPGGSIQHCTITTIDESPAQAGVIWVGTDDGKVQVTRDAGAHWSDVTPKIAEDGWTTRVYASRYAPGTAYVTKSRKRQDDFTPFVFRTTDFGATWTRVSEGLTGAANVIVEDTVKATLLFAGTDTGVFASFDTGVHWLPVKSNMPVVPVHDMVVHPREGELVAGTYGRGLWVADTTPLREMGGDFLTRDTVLFPVRAFAQRSGGSWGNYRLHGDLFPTTQNDPNGMTIAYYLKQSQPASVTITDAKGGVVRKLNGTANAGINRVVWNLDDAQGNPAAAGEYVVTLEAGGKMQAQKAQLLSRAPEDSPRPRFGR